MKQIFPVGLYIVATPIGNLKDVTYRAIEVLKEVDCIAAEDTRVSRKLLTRYNITGKRLYSYFAPKEESKARKLLELLLEGQSVALITDAGTPGISDPAGRLVRSAIENGIDVIPIPGPTAMTAALCASGLATDSFVFAGFLPVKKGKRLAKIKSLCAEGRTVVLYESTHRIVKLLSELEDEIPLRKVVIAREITKMFEEFLRGTPSELMEKLTGKKTKGEFVVLIPSEKDRFL